YLMGGSADLAGSNKSTMEGVEFFSKENPHGRNIHFGIREHAMAAIGNGLALYGGIKPYVATFLVFSDYLKGAMRLSAIMEVPLTYILTHDSIGVGEDGPTHQPIEQLSMIRSLPNINLFRPADAVETAYAWKVAMESTRVPTAMALTRQNLPNLEGSGEGTEKGGYIISKETRDLELILMASGSEVQYCVEAKKRLEDEGYGVRVVSMPCMDLFDNQNDEYKESVLPKDIRKRVSMEAAATLPWYKYVGLDGITIGLDRFGESGPGEKVFEHFNLNGQRVYDESKKLL
ncbi:MAG: transketolase C-terminal domain-containing protein, partial [Gallicola sp.]|nr:transketolase C-terminal domain-containing protein [Gallicola sp.]